MGNYREQTKKYITLVKFSNLYIRVLPKSPLRENWVQAPAAMDGIPAPISRLVNPMDSVNAKNIVIEALLDDFRYGSEPSAKWEEDMTWYGSVGFGIATNKQENIFIKKIIKI